MTGLGGRLSAIHHGSRPVLAVVEPTSRAALVQARADALGGTDDVGEQHRGQDPIGLGPRRDPIKKFSISSSI
jgi:hypothetical protein